MSSTEFSHFSLSEIWSRIKCSVGCKRGDIRPAFSSVTKCLNTDKCIQLSCTAAVDGKYFLRETTAPPATFIHVPLVRRIVYPSGCVLLHPSHLQPSNTRNSLPWSVVLVVQLQIRQFRTLCNYPYMCSFILPSQDRKHFSDHPIPKIIPFYPLSILSEIDLTPLFDGLYRVAHDRVGRLLCIPRRTLSSYGFRRPERKIKSNDIPEQLDEKSLCLSSASHLERLASSFRGPKDSEKPLNICGQLGMVHWYRKCSVFKLVGNYWIGHRYVRAYRWPPLHFQELHK